MFQISALGFLTNFSGSRWQPMTELHLERVGA